MSKFVSYRTSSFYSKKKMLTKATVCRSIGSPTESRKKNSYTIYRKAYKPLPVSVPEIFIEIQFQDEYTMITCRTEILLKKKSDKDFIEAHGLAPAKFVSQNGLALHGRKNLRLQEIELNGLPLTEGIHYERHIYGLKLLPQGLPLFENLSCGKDSRWELKTRVIVEPQMNDELEGLYVSGGVFCTQCEAEGFRAITFAFDRPDVLSRYTTRLIAHKEKYPVLLSNGNLAQSGVWGMRHYAQWFDPHPKPTYLFAAVAGNLACLKDRFRTVSGREILLNIYTNERYLQHIGHAMSSLKKAMHWDEKKWGREYDLDIYNIVTVDDFNSEAMENKSLNIFNTLDVLASPETTSMERYEMIEANIAHEYFHNWTGNRVTCRDWFQLTLKEGLTRYREQEFAADVDPCSVRRLKDINAIRQQQFVEDYSSMAHPIRPESYEVIDNFYTVTVYEKGAEVVRMLETLLGETRFRKGLDLYFQRHDGDAVVCEDFVRAMEDANGENFTQFMRWYSTVGIPVVTLESCFDPETGIFTLHTTQHIETHAGVFDASPLVIPLRLALLHPIDGRTFHLRVIKEHIYEVGGECQEIMLRIHKTNMSFIFCGLQECRSGPPILSAFRGFSSPVRFAVKNQTTRDLDMLLRYDTDSFIRFDVCQKLGRIILSKFYERARGHLLKLYGTDVEYGGDISSGKGQKRNISLEMCTMEKLLEGGDGELALLFYKHLVDNFRVILSEKGLNERFKAYTLSLPNMESLLVETPYSTLDPPLFHALSKFLYKKLAQSLRPELEQILQAYHSSSPWSQMMTDSRKSCANRLSILNQAFRVLAKLEETHIETRLLHRMRTATTMTEELACLEALNYDCPSRQLALAEFYEKWKDDTFVILSWYTVHATANIPGNLKVIERYARSPGFQRSKPNNVFALIGKFRESEINFHAADYTGYEFMTRQILNLDKANGQLASSIAKCFSYFRYYTPGRQKKIFDLLQLMLEEKTLSRNVSEVLRKILNK